MKKIMNCFSKNIMSKYYRNKMKYKIKYSHDEKYYHEKYYKYYNDGFIAMIVVISVAGILLALVFSSSIESGLFYDQALKKEYRAMNHYYAYDCIDQAILALAHDYFFTVTDPIEIPKYHCSIVFVRRPMIEDIGIGDMNISQDDIQEDIRIIRTKGNFMKADVYRHAKVRLHEHSIEVISVE